MSRRTLTFAMSVLTVGALAACGSSSDPLGSSTTTSAAGVEQRLREHEHRGGLGGLLLKASCWPKSMPAP